MTSINPDHESGIPSDRRRFLKQMGFIVFLTAGIDKASASHPAPAPQMGDCTEYDAACGTRNTLSTGYTQDQDCGHANSKGDQDCGLRTDYYVQSGWQDNDCVSPMPEGSQDWSDRDCGIWHNFGGHSDSDCGVQVAGGGVNTDQDCGKYGSLIPPTIQNDADCEASGSDSECWVLDLAEDPTKPYYDCGGGDNPPPGP